MFVEEVYSGQIVGGLESCCGSDRGKEVDGVGEVGRAGGAYSGRPGQQDRRANAVFVGRAFRAQSVSGPERLIRVVGVLGARNPTVVADVDDQRVLGQSFCIQIAEKCTASLVEPCAHRVVLGDIFRPTGSLVVRQKAIGRIVRRMGKKGRIPDEEGRFSPRCFVDEIGDGRH